MPTGRGEPEPHDPVVRRFVLHGWYNAAGACNHERQDLHRGQTSLPADLRHRWGLDDGGDIGFIDLGEAALIVPGGTGPARAELRRVLADRYDNGLSTISDPDLADQPA